LEAEVFYGSLLPC